jgi:hypothetical protein
MAELLLLGMTHYPPLAAVDGDMAGLMRVMLADPGIPEAAKDPASWSAEARAEWGDDEGRSSAAAHRAVLRAGFSRLRTELDAFAPDALLVWGDDQYENFREDVVPPYALLAYDDVETEPWAHFAWNNVWGETKDHAHKVRGRPDIARWLAERLLEDDIDVAYAYRPLHHGGLAHAFMNTQLYLDYDRVGFPWAMVCMPINCYGRRVIAARGFCRPYGQPLELDPPSPTPRRLMTVGGAVARHLADSPWRVAVVASSSWSHAFLCDKTYRLTPDTASDRALYDALAAGDFERWEATTTAEIEDAGQQEVLNWFALAGAARELGLGGPTWSTFVETWCFNSNKVFASWGRDDDGR